MLDRFQIGFITGLITMNVYIMFMHYLKIITQKYLIIILIMILLITLIFNIKNKEVKK